MCGDGGVQIKWFPEIWMEMLCYKCQHYGEKCLHGDPEEEGLPTLSNLTVYVCRKLPLWSVPSHT